MFLYGWKYEGRKISEQLHEQIMFIIDVINTPEIVGDKNWPELQTYLSLKLGIATGQIRTIKRMMEEFEIVKRGSLNAKEIPSATVFTDSGRTLINLFETEKLMQQQKTLENAETINEIKNIYKLYYQKVLSNYTYNNNGVILHPLKATLKALTQFGRLDYWEWYILNTIITSDDNPDEEQELARIITAYRAKELRFTENDIKENKLSHSYVLGNFEFAGLVKVEGNKHNLKITINESSKLTVDAIIES